MKDLPFLDADALNAIDVPVLDAMAAIEAGLGALGRSEASQPNPPVLSPSAGAFFQPLVAGLPEQNTACVNWLTYHPDNATVGLPHSGGILILNDLSRGMPLCVMDGIWVSHRRTGYIAGIGVKYLAPAFEDVALIGPGAIAAFAIDALVAMGRMKGKLKVCSRRRETAERFCREMSVRHGIEAIPVLEPREAVDGAHLILTATTHKGTPFLQRDWVAKGSLVVMIDRLRVITRELLDDADRVVTNSAASLAHWGFGGDGRPVEIMPAIVGARALVPVGPDQICLYDAGGLAIADLAYASLLWSRLQGRDEMVPPPP